MKTCFALAIALPLAFSAASGGARAAPFADILVAAHNSERMDMGLSPMNWEPSLAAAADAYALELARNETWGHSPREERAGQGENLWRGTRGAFALERMLQAWADEKRYFRAGVFPNITDGRTSWHEVGHYTQMVWPATTKVGCSLRSSPNWDYLVCRYSAPGNVMGQRIGPVNVASR
jgi:hypothetical protein